MGGIAGGKLRERERVRESKGKKNLALINVDVYNNEKRQRIQKAKWSPVLF